MELNEYQKRAMTTCMASSDNFSYMMLNLVGEVGEFSSKVAKQIRKGFMSIGDNEVNHLDYGNASLESVMDLKKELGDILWQTAGLANVLGWSLEEIAQDNLDKLADRQKRNVIDGNGDNR